MVLEAIINSKFQVTQFKIRSISASDNEELARIIRSTLTEFGANKPGTVFYDSATDALFELFQENAAAYFVAEIDGKLVGGGESTSTSKHRHAFFVQFLGQGLCHP